MKLQDETKTILWNMFNDVTCKMCDEVEALHAKGAHSVANHKQRVINELDAVAKLLNLFDEENESETIKTARKNLEQLLDFTY